MDIKLGSARLSLARGQLVRIDRARGTSIHGVDGLLWVTQAGDQQDYFLRAGERLSVARDGPVVIHALRPSAFRVEARDADESALEPWWNPFQRSRVAA